MRKRVRKKERDNMYVHMCVSEILYTITCTHRRVSAIIDRLVSHVRRGQMQLSFIPLVAHDPFYAKLESIMLSVNAGTDLLKSSINSFDIIYKQKILGNR